MVAYVENTAQLETWARDTGHGSQPITYVLTQLNSTSNYGRR